MHPSARALARIEVVHLDGWIGSLLRTHGYPYELEYWKEGEGRLWDRWQAALERRPGDLPETFFREEWDYVIQPSGCATLDDYIAAPRAGRGVRLTRAQRRAIWPVFEDYRNALESARLRESVDAMRDAAGLLERREVVLGYKAVVVDEAQDMSTVAFRLLRQAVPAGPNDMFLVGDGHQRIYRRQVVLGQAGVHIVGRSRRLRVNYRTTDELRRAAGALLEGVRVDDLDGGADTTAGYRSLVHGDPPQVVRCKTFDEEVAAIACFVSGGDLTRTCLAARTHQLVSQYAAALESRGVPVHRVARRKAEDRSAPGLRIATLHRVKGLEFDRVAIAGVNEGVVPLSAAVSRTDDAAVGEDAERQERALLYVGLTRARRAAQVSSFGLPSKWLGSLTTTQ